MERFDAIIIGAGQAGVPLASDLAAAGQHVALVERQFLGGSCVNEGCTPTKTVIASAQVAHLARRAAEYGVDTGPVRVDLERVRARKRRIVMDSRGGLEKSLGSTKNLTVLHGQARFTSAYQLQVNLESGQFRNLESDQIFINTGTRNRLPNIPGLQDVPFLDNSSLMELAEIPQRLIVLGGGYIGLEFGQAFARFGSQVVILEAGDSFLPREDSDISAAMRDMLHGEGIEVRLQSRVASVRRHGDGLELELSGAPGVRGSHLLVAVGRQPNTDDLGLDIAGISTDEHGFIKVNDHLETNMSGVYALGDVKGGAAFTHVSYDDYRILRDDLLHGKRRRVKDRVVAYTVFTDPQLARVGITASAAKGQGLNAEVYTMPMTRVARARETAETQGLMTAVVDSTSGLILGAAVLGAEGGELMGILHTAMLGRVPFTTLREAAFAHPTFSEALNNLFTTKPRAV